jgi:trehalose 6-phosphate phosphatase
MIGHLFHHLPEIRTRIAHARCLLFLDFDGTLAPIVDFPEDAMLPAKTREILTTLYSQKQIRLAVISGRSLVDLQRRVGLNNVIYAGNHGLEIEGQGLQFVEPSAERSRPGLLEITTRLSAQLGSTPGAQVEYKGLSASVHYRRAPASSWVEIRHRVESAVASSDGRFVMKEGNRIYEIRPSVPWHKGAAVNWIRTALGMQRDLAVYIGDDATDEDAFSELTDGITIKVGSAAATSANYFAGDTEEIQQFLLWLTEIHQATFSGEL